MSEASDALKCLKTAGTRRDRNRRPVDYELTATPVCYWFWSRLRCWNVGQIGSIAANWTIFWTTIRAPSIISRRVWVDRQQAMRWCKTAPGRWQHIAPATEAYDTD